MITAERYRMFAELEAAGSSLSYERLALAVSSDPSLVACLDELPPLKRQPNLLFAACRYLDAPMSETGEAMAFVHDRWIDVAAVMTERSTQTNEPARSAVFLPLLARIGHPIALIEVGASAGLCLYPDRYRIQYDDGSPCGPADSAVSIRVRTDATVRAPIAPPEIRWRAGIDLHPLDVADADDMAWLSACIWPEHAERQRRLRAAITVASDDPPNLYEGDLVDSIEDVIRATPAGTRPVVCHSAVLGYLEPQRRAEFGDLMRSHPEVLWISNEGPGVLQGLATDVAPPPHAHVRAFFILATSGSDIVGISDPHGSWIKWLR